MFLPAMDTVLAKTRPGTHNHNILMSAPFASYCFSANYDSRDLNCESSADEDWEAFDPADVYDLKKVCVAVKKGQNVIIRRFLATQLVAILLVRSAANDTVLHLAARNGNDELVSLILEKVPSTQLAEFLNLGNYSRETALHLASFSGHLEVVKALLSRGATLNPNYFGETPFYAAAYNGHLPVISLSLLSGPSFFSLSTGYPVLVKQLCGLPLHAGQRGWSLP
jgi:ankyrin repeat protein